MSQGSADFRKRDRIVLYTILAHVPVAGIVGAVYGHVLIGAAIAAVAAALGAFAFWQTGGTRAFRVYGAALLMFDSAAVIAAGGGETAMHIHIFIVMTFLIMYFDWLPIAVAGVTIALHHIIGNIFFPQLVFGDMSGAHTWVTVALHAGAVAMEAVVAIFVAQRIRNGVSAIGSVSLDMAHAQMPLFRAAIAALADGDLSRAAHVEIHRLTIDSSDEIGGMAATLNELGDEIAASVAAFEVTRQNLRGIVGALMASATQLTDASTSFASSTGEANMAVESISLTLETMAEGTRAQTEQVEGVSAAVEELARSASQIAAGASDQTTAVHGVVAEVQALDGGIAGVAERGKQMSSFVQLATVEASSGIEAVTETEQAVIGLRVQLLANATLMGSLETRSAAVKDIVKVVNEIAEQTNLLALNAAIEAARAGDQGRGFAVVADEVRKLAERSATSTREIGQILEAIRSETVEAATSMRGSSASMENGLALATRAKGALQALGAKIDETSRVGAAMVTGAQTMSAASSRATANVESVSAIIEENAAAAGEVGSTTASVADSLVALRSTYKDRAGAATSVTNSVITLAERLIEMQTAADLVLNQGASLTDIVGRFRLEGAGAAAPPAVGQPPAQRLTALSVQQPYVDERRGTGNATTLR